MFELDVRNQNKEEIPTDTKELKLLHSTKVLNTLHRIKTKRISDQAYREMYESGGWQETPIVPKESQVEEFDESEYRKLVIASYGMLLDILAHARDNLPQLQKIEFDSSLKLGFLEPTKLANIAKNIPQGVKHLYLNDQGFAHVYSCKDAVTCFFSSLPLNLFTLQVSNMQKYIATALKELKTPQSIKNLILSDNKIFEYNKETLTKLFTSIGNIFSLDTFAVINENVKFGILDILLQKIKAKKMVFARNNYFVNLVDYNDLTIGLKNINPLICHLDLSENNLHGTILNTHDAMRKLTRALCNVPSKLAIDFHGSEFNKPIFQLAIERGNNDLFKLLFKLGVAINRQNLRATAQQSPAAANIVALLLNYGRMEPLLYARMLAQNRRRTVPPIGKLSSKNDMLELVSEMLTGNTKFRRNG